MIGVRPKLMASSFCRHAQTAARTVSVGFTDPQSMVTAGCRPEAHFLRLQPGNQESIVFLSVCTKTATLCARLACALSDKAWNSLSQSIQHRYARLQESRAWMSIQVRVI